MSTTSTVLSFFNRTLSKICYNFNFNKSTMRWAMKQCETFESTKIDIRCFLTTISKRSHALNLRRSFFSMTIKNISSTTFCCLNLYELIFFDVMIQGLNVSSFDLCADSAEICSFSIDFSFCTSSATSFKSEIFKLSYCSCVYDFILFSCFSFFETFNLKSFG